MFGQKRRVKVWLQKEDLKHWLSTCVGHEPLRSNEPFTGSHIRYSAYWTFALQFVTVAISQL